MHHARADRSCGLRYRFGALALHRLECLCTALGQNADEVDGDMGIAHRGLDRSRIAQIGLNAVDLADLAERLQMSGELRTPHGDPDTVIALGERANHVASQKARSSENRNQGVQIGGHKVNSCRSMRWVAGCSADPRYAIEPALYRLPEHDPQKALVRRSCSELMRAHFANLTSARGIRSN